MLAVPRRHHGRGVFTGDYEAEDLVKWQWAHRAPGHWLNHVATVVILRRTLYFSFLRMNYSLGNVRAIFC